MLEHEHETDIAHTDMRCVLLQVRAGDYIFTFALSKKVHSCFIFLAGTQKRPNSNLLSICIKLPSAHSPVDSAEEQPLVFVLNKRHCVIYSRETPRSTISPDPRRARSEESTSSATWETRERRTECKVLLKTWIWIHLMYYYYLLSKFTVINKFFVVLLISCNKWCHLKAWRQSLSSVKTIAFVTIFVSE